MRTGVWLLGGVRSPGGGACSTQGTQVFPFQDLPQALCSLEILPDLASSGKTREGSGALGRTLPFSEPPSDLAAFQPGVPRPHLQPPATPPSPGPHLALVWPSWCSNARAFPDGGAWVKGPTLPSQDAGCWAGFSRRKQHVEAILQRKDSRSRRDISWEEFETSHSCWQPQLAPRMWVSAWDYFFSRLYVCVCTYFFCPLKPTAWSALKWPIPSFFWIRAFRMGSPRCLRASCNLCTN